MITNTHRGDFYNTPLHRLTKASHTVVWIRGMRNMPGGAGRLVLANTLHKLYPEGVGVCSDTCRLMSYINPIGGIRDLPQPWPEYPIHQMVNNPKAVQGSTNECPCLDFIDPEVGGPWRIRGENRHHPLCMYSKNSMKRYQHFVNLGRVPDRPDAWYRSLKEIPE